MYFVISSGQVTCQKELSIAELEKLKAGELVAINYKDMMTFNRRNESWEKINLDVSDKSNVSTDVTLDSKAILLIRSMAMRMFIDKAMPKNLNQIEIQSYLLFSALREYLLQRGVDPKFKLGKM